MKTVCKGLGANVNMDDNGLWTIGNAGIAMGHGDGSDFRGTGDYPRPLIEALSLSLDDGLDDGWMV
jgi:hypothetical protein